MLNRKEIETDIDSPYIKETLKDLIKIKSISQPDFGGEEEAAKYLIEQMEKLNLECEFDKIVPGRANAVGILKGWEKTGPTLVLNGHHDVVPANIGVWKDMPFNPVIKDGRIYGRGAADMKGALASMLGAVKYIKDKGIKISGDLLLAFVCDEEVTNLGSLRFLDEYTDLDFAIIGEPTSLKMAIAHRGVIRYKIKVKGVAGHASEPDQADNAIYNMLAVVAQIQQYNEKLKQRKHIILPGPSVAVTVIQGGDKGNIIPGECEIIIDRRLIPGEDKEKVLSEINNLLKIQKANYSLEKIVYLKPGAISVDNMFVDRMKSYYCKYFNINHAPVGSFRASCEQSLFLERNIDTIIFGPGDISQAHSVDEFIEEKQLIKAAGFYVYSILNLLT